MGVDDQGATQADGSAEASGIVSFPKRESARDVTFDRRELTAILNVYGRMVAAGEWRDYAIDHLADRAVFSVFRRTAEVPLYRIEKVPRAAARQGAYSVTDAGGRILKRGPEIARVLAVLEKKPRLIGE